MSKQKNRVKPVELLVLKGSELAEFFSISPRQVSNWVADGMPKIAYGKYNLQDCFNWWNENINKPISDKEEKAREKYWSAKAEREQILVEKLKETVIDKEQVVKEWCFRLQEIIKGIESQEIIFPDLFAEKSKDEIRDLVKKYNRRLREGYAREGRYTPVVMDKIQLAEVVQGLKEELARFYLKPGKKRQR